MVYLTSPTLAVIVSDETYSNTYSPGEVYPSDYYQDEDVSLWLPVMSYVCTYPSDEASGSVRERVRQAVKRGSDRFGGISRIPLFLYRPQLVVTMRSVPDQFGTRRQTGRFECLKSDFYRGQIIPGSGPGQVTITLPDQTRKVYTFRLV